MCGIAALPESGCSSHDYHFEKWPAVPVGAIATAHIVSEKNSLATPSLMTLAQIKKMLFNIVEVQ